MGESKLAVSEHIKGGYTIAVKFSTRCKKFVGQQMSMGLMIIEKTWCIGGAFNITQ